MRTALAMVVGLTGADVLYDVQMLPEQDMSGDETYVIRYRGTSDSDYEYGWVSQNWQTIGLPDDYPWETNLYGQKGYMADVLERQAEARMGAAGLGL